MKVGNGRQLLQIRKQQLQTWKQCVHDEVLYHLTKIFKSNDYLKVKCKILRVEIQNFIFK
jgi:hypothetical protein